MSEAPAGPGQVGRPRRIHDALAAGLRPLIVEAEVVERVAPVGLLLGPWRFVAVPRIHPV